MGFLIVPSRNACCVYCSAVFHNELNSVGCCVASWTGICNDSNQPLLTSQKGWVMSIPQPGQMDPFLIGKGGCRRVGAGRPSKQLSVVLEDLDEAVGELSKFMLLEAGVEWIG